MKKVVVIGAGILGTSVAYHLSKHDVQLTLVDKEEKGQATAAAAGIICPWLSQRRNKAWYRLASNGARYYDTLIRELESLGETSTGYAKVGALCLHHDENKLIAMKERAEKRKIDAPELGDLTFITKEEAKRQFPLLSEGYHILHVSGAARVDGRALTEAMKRIAFSRSVAYIAGEAKIEVHAGQVVGVTVNGDFVEADEVVVCAGAWSNQLLHPLGINVQVDYQKAQIIHLLAKDNEETAKWPVIMPPNDQYLLAFDQQKVVIGATHENDVVGYDTAATVSGMHDIMQKGLTVANGIKDCQFAEVRVGFRPFTANFLPVFGRVATYDNLIVANGLGSSGLTAGPYIGSQVAKLVLNKEIDLPLEDYKLDLAQK